MTDKPPGRSHLDRAKLLLASSVNVYADTLEAFENLRDKIAEGTVLPKARFPEAIAQLNRARQSLITELQKHDRTFFPADGDESGAAVDFDAMRDKIGSRLDRIRASGRSGRVSGEPDEG